MGHQASEALTSNPRWQFWIDRGGTFTDIVARKPDGTLLTHKLVFDLLDRGEAPQYLLQAVVAQRSKAPASRSLGDCGERRAFDEQAAHFFVRHHQLMNADAPPEPSFATLFAACAAVKRNVRVAVELEMAFEQLSRRFVGHAAGGAYSLHQVLREHPEQRGPEHVSLHAELQQTGHRLQRTARVQRGEHQVPGQRRLGCNLSDLLVADLADENDVRVLAQEAAQQLGKAQVDGAVHGDLRGPW
jgi:hypothetical protein